MNGIQQLLDAGYSEEEAKMIAELGDINTSANDEEFLNGLAEFDPETEFGLQEAGVLTVEIRKKITPET